MKRKIIGVTVGTSMSPQTIMDKLHPVISVNGMRADENGNVKVETEPVSDEQIANSVEVYLKDNPPSYRITINGVEPDENGNIAIESIPGIGNSVVEF